MKTCSKCKTEKSISKFYKSSKTKDKLGFYCKVCCSKAMSAVRERHRNNVQIKINKISKICGICKKEKLAEEFYKTKYSKDGLRCYCKKCSAKKEKIYAAAPKAKQKRNNRWHQYYKNPEFRLRTNISRMIRAALKNGKFGKSITEYLPYTFDELKIHLEIQFDDKMSWNNYGTYWWIDHIIPQTALPYNTMNDENFLKSWSLNNLRPLEKIENIIKGNKVNG